jgi:hypothetical protein
MPKERRLAAPPEIKLPSLELESTGTGLLGAITGGHARARNAARQAYRDAVALGMDPAEAARLYGPQIMGPGFVPPKTKAERQAEEGAYRQSLARQVFPEPETREVPTGAYQVGPPTGEYTEFFQPAQYEPEPEAFTATPTGAPIPTYREAIPSVEGQPMRLPRREPIEHRRAPGGGVLEPEVRQEIFQPPAPTRAQLLARQLPSQVGMFEKAYPEILEARKADVERQVAQGLAEPAPPGAPPTPGVPAPAPGAPPTPGAPALSPTEQVEAGYEQGIQRLRANPEWLLSDAGKNFLERKAKDMDIAQKREEAQDKRATAESVQRFRTHARQQGDAAEAEGDTERRDFWRAAEANPTQYLPQAKERAERADKADANRQRRNIFTQMADAATDPKDKALYQLAAVDQKTAEDVGRVLAESGKPVEVKGVMYKYVQTPEGLAMVRLPGQPPPEAGDEWKKIKDRFGDDIATELAGMPGVDPGKVTSTEIAEANRRLDLKKTARAKAGATTVEIKPAPTERKEIATGLVREQVGAQVLDIIDEYPHMFGGIGGAKGYARGWLTWADVGTPEEKEAWTAAESGLGALALALRHEMIGAGMTGTEIGYTKFLPDPTKQTGTQLKTNIRLTMENTRQLREYNERIRKGETGITVPPPVSTAEYLKRLRGVGQRPKPQGPSEERTPPKPTPSEGGSVKPVPGGGTLRKLPD